MGFVNRLGMVARAAVAAHQDASAGAGLISLGIQSCAATGAEIEKRVGNPLENPSVPLGGPGFFAWLFSGEVTESGESINATMALQQSTVYTCVRIIAESLGSLPVKVYERIGEGRREATEQSLYWLLRYQPNVEMTACTMLESLAGSLALTGNCYAQIMTNAAGRITSLYPLHPLKTEPVRLKTGELWYRTSDGESLGNWRYIPPDSMVHVPLFSFDGVCGLNPIQQCKQMIGGAKAAQKFGARFFGNGSRPGGVLTPRTGARLDEKTISQVKESWTAMQAGINQGKTAVIPGDWEYQQITLSPEDSQFLETRKFDRTEICGLFRVPPHMAGDTTRLSNSNHEQQSLQFVTDTLRPYIVKFEQEFMRKLLPYTVRNSGKYFLSFDVSERLRGDFETTMQGYALGRQWGWLHADDILEDMGRNPIGKEKGGQIYYAPQNMVNLENFLPENGGGAAKLVDGGPEAGEGMGLQEKSSLRFALAYIAMFRDAVGRLCKREKRDFDTLSAIFGPVLVSFSGQLRDVYGLKFGLKDGWTDAGEVAAEQLRAMGKRFEQWEAAQADAVAMQELHRVLVGMSAELAQRAGRAAAQEFNGRGE